MIKTAQSVLGWAFLTCLALGSFAAGSAGASTSNDETITFIDSTEDPVSVSQNGNRLVCLGPFIEGANCTLSAPTGATFQSSTLPTNGFPYTFGEPGPPSPDGLFQASDSINLCAASSPCGTPLQDTSLSLNFSSDSDNINVLLVCSQTPGVPCNVTETGMIQLAGTITWSDGTVDTINICSDVEGVRSNCPATPRAPEPGTLMLFGSGLVSIVGFARRKIFIGA